MAQQAWWPEPPQDLVTHRKKGKNKPLQQSSDLCTHAMQVLPHHKHNK